MTKTKKSRPLAEKIETIVEPSAPIPAELQTFLDEFFLELSAMSDLPDLDLTTPEGAREASKILSERFIDIQEKMKTAKALTAILEQEKAAPGSFDKLPE